MPAERDFPWFCTSESSTRRITAVYVAECSEPGLELGSIWATRQLQFQPCTGELEGAEAPVHSIERSRAPRRLLLCVWAAAVLVARYRLAPSIARDRQYNPLSDCQCAVLSHYFESFGMHVHLDHLCVLVLTVVGLLIVLLKQLAATCS